MKSNRTKFHAGLHVSDIGKSVKFYTDLFNSEPVKVKTDYAKFETAEIVLSLIHSPAKVQPGFGHFGLKVENDPQLREYHHRLKNAGHALVEEEQVDCCYAVQDKFWVKDPDGFDWEVYTFIKDTDKSLRPEAELVSSDNACCTPDCC